MIENPNVICNNCEYCRYNIELRKILKKCIQAINESNYQSKEKLLQKARRVLGEEDNNR